MTKNPPTEVTEADIASYLATDSDFSFEVQIKKRLTGLGFHVEQGGTYVDEVTKKTREYDLRAKWFHGNKRGYLAVECKNISALSPLVIHRLKRWHSEAYQDLVYVPHLPRKTTTVQVALQTAEDRARHLRADGWVFRMLDGDGLYTTADFVGKSMDQVENKNGRSVGSDAEVFGKMSQAISSAFEMVEQAADQKRDEQNSYIAILPVLIVSDNNLWVVDYDDQGQQLGAARRVSHTSYFIDRVTKSGFRGDQEFFKFSHLEICTASGLEPLLKSYFIDNAHTHPKAFGDKGRVELESMRAQSQSGA